MATKPYSSICLQASQKDSAVFRRSFVMSLNLTPGVLFSQRAAHTSLTWTTHMYQICKADVDADAESDTDADADADAGEDVVFVYVWE